MSSDINKKMMEEAEIGILAGNLRTLMSRFSIDSSELSKKTGIALTTINGLKRGSGNPTLSTLYQLAEFFDVSIGQLTEQKISLVDKSARIVYEIPLLALDELADFLKNHSKYKNTISTELDLWEPNKYYATKINNNSMHPLFEKGSIFIIARNIHIHDVDIVLVQFNKHPPCFRKIFIEGKSYFFKPISELIGGNVIKDDNFIIHGIIIKAIQYFHD